MTLFWVEVRRALHRRLVWSLLAVAFVGIAAMALIAFFDSASKDVVAAHARGEAHPAMMVDWWIAGGGDGVLVIGAFFLIMGALIGGASVTGAEWRAGTMTTVLTWEPRRVRLFTARVGAAVACAVVIATSLQALLLASLLPAVFTHGSTAGVDADWALGTAAAVGRISLIAGLATLIGACLAFATRNTAAAIVGVWAWLSIIEALLRIHRPGVSGLLLGENLTRVLTWGDIRGAAVSRSPQSALLLLAIYAAACSVLCAAHFRRTDVAAT